MELLWRKETSKISHSVSNDMEWDIIVVGAGLAGILTAYYLKERGKKVLVIEAKTVASGQTERTTAKITSQHDLKYAKLIDTIGIEKARMYAQANEFAIREYERLIQKKKISCRFEKVSSYLYSKEDVNILKREEGAAISLGIDAFFTLETELPFPVTGAVGFRNQAQFSPLEFVQHICKELIILEHKKVVKIKEHQVLTDNEVFHAEKIVIATHYPILNIPGFYFLRQHQERSYVLALSGCKEIEGMYYGIDNDGLSFRQAGKYLLLGGGQHRTGENKNGEMYHMLLKEAKKYFPDCKEEMYW